MFIMYLYCIKKPYPQFMATLPLSVQWDLSCGDTPVYIIKCPGMTVPPKKDLWKFKNLNLLKYSYKSVSLILLKSDVNSHLSFDLLGPLCRWRSILLLFITIIMVSVEETSTTAVPRQQATAGRPPRPSAAAASSKRPLEGHSTPTP